MEIKFSEKLKKTLDQINKVQGEKTVIALSNETLNDFKVDVLCSTGSKNLDLALGCGGWPKGRITEIYGPESSGKSTLALHAIAETQKRGGIAAYIDVEHSFDPIYSEAVGVNNSALIFSQPQNGEQALDVLQALIDSGEVNLVILDSVAALVPKKELEGQSGELTVGLMARLMGQAMRKITPVCGRTGTTIIFINQLREKIGVMFGNPETTPGGNSLKFYASVRLDIRRTEKVESGETNSEGRKEYSANTVRVKVVKNKVGIPFKEASFDIVYGKGISAESELVSAAIKLGVLKGTGKGIEVDFDTPFYDRDIAINSTVAKTIDSLTSDPLFFALKKEIEFKVAEELKDTQTAQALAQFLIDETEVALKKQSAFKEYFTLGNTASSSSKLVEAKYFFELALKNKFWSKEAKVKLAAIEKRIQEKLNKGEEINWWVLTSPHTKLNVQTGEEVKIEVDEATSLAESQTK